MLLINLQTFTAFAQAPVNNFPNTTISLVEFGTTPNGIYQKLTEMKTSNHPEAANIQTGVESNAPTSKGACN